MSENNEVKKIQNESFGQWSNMEHPEEPESTEVEDLDLETLESDEMSESGEEYAEDEIRRKIGSAMLGAESPSQTQSMTGTVLMEKFDDNIRNYKSYMYETTGNDEQFRSLFEPHLKRLNGVLESTISELQAQNPENSEVSAESILKLLQEKRLEMAQEGVALRDEVDRCKIEGDKAGLKEAERKRTEHVKVSSDIDRVYEMAYGFTHKKEETNLYAGLAKYASDRASLYADGRKTAETDREHAIYAVESVDRAMVILSEKAEGRNISELSRQEVMDIYQEYDRDTTAKCKQSQEELARYRNSLGFFGSIIGEKAKKLKALERADILTFDRHIQSSRIFSMLHEIYEEE